MVLFEGYDSDTTDFAPFINKIPPGTDAVMGGGHFADTTTLTRQLYEKKVQRQDVRLAGGAAGAQVRRTGRGLHLAVVGSSQWEPVAKYSPEAAKAAGMEWFGPTVAGI